MLIKRTPPKNLTDSDVIFFKNELEKELNYLYNYSSYQNVVVTFHGAVFLGWKLIEENLVTISHKSFFNLKYHLKTIIKFKKQEVNIKNCVLIFDLWSSGYFHWMTDSLTRLLSFISLVEIKDIVFLLPENGPEFQTETLKILGFNSFVFIPPNRFLKFKKLYIPHFVAPTGNYNEALIDELRSLFFKNLEFDFITPSKFIYVSRKHSERRKIQNEDELIDLLLKWNFEIVYFEKMSVKQQFELLSQTKVLIGQHGAGLTNMLFMQKGTKVLELRLENDKTNLCYFSLASALKILYYYQFCNNGNILKSNLDTEFIVDIEEMEVNLNSLLNEHF
ncbi:MAG: glycosyltransferase family 61 protein [Bacteroidota bacterium]|nr:glycosyltransferase family 61 protein [Bacteroidota bacterium]